MRGSKRVGRTDGQITPWVVAGAVGSSSVGNRTRAGLVLVSYALELTLFYARGGRIRMPRIGESSGDGATPDNDLHSCEFGSAKLATI
jgi:hypothetical protein